MEIGFNLLMLGITGVIFIMFLMVWSYLLGKYYERYKSKLRRSKQEAMQSEARNSSQA